MFTKSKDGSELQKRIDTVLQELSTFESNSAQYAASVNQLAQLYEIKTKSQDRITKDTLLIVGANLFGIALIVGYEHANVVTSKALAFVQKLR